METHVKVLAVLYIVFGALGVLGALAIMAVFGIAGVATAAAIPGDPNAAIALPIIGLTGTALAVFLLIVSLPGVIAGVGLLKFRLNFPFGTILGIYGLWVLFSEPGARLFGAARPATTS